MRREIRIEDATTEWLEGYYDRFRVARSMGVSEATARTYYLGDALGMCVAHIFVMEGFVSFTVDEVYRDTITMLMDTTILYQGKRLALAGIGAELFSVPYQEGESAAVRLEFREETPPITEAS